MHSCTDRLISILGPRSVPVLDLDRSPFLRTGTIPVVTWTIVHVRACLRNPH